MSLCRLQSLFNSVSPKTFELNLFVLNKQMNGLCWKSKQSCALLDKEFVKSLLSCFLMLLRLFFSSLNVSKGKVEGFVVRPMSVTSLTHIFYQILGIGRDRNFQKGCTVLPTDGSLNWIHGNYLIFENCLSNLEIFPIFNKSEMLATLTERFFSIVFFDPYLLSFVCYSALLFLFLFLPKNKTEILLSNSLWLTNLKICSLKLLMMFVSKWL